MLRAALFLSLLAVPAMAAAEPLTIRTGESWTFSLRNGEPVKTRRVKASAKPARGEIRATLTSLGGTSLTLTNNSATGYTFRASLVGAKGKATTRTCTLPPGLNPVLEYWPQKASAVRIGNFRATSGAGSCPSAN